MKLTRRQRDIIGLVMLGLSDRKIAKALDLSGFTIRNHLSTIYAKAGVHSRAELLAKRLRSRPRGTGRHLHTCKCGLQFYGAKPCDRNRPSRKIEN